MTRDEHEQLLKYKELSAELSLQLSEKMKTIKRCHDAIDNIHTIIFCVGGSLNDNLLKYTNEQLVNFSNIYEQLEYSGFV